VELHDHGQPLHVNVFDWVEQAYEDPRTCSLTYRLHALHAPRSRWDGAEGAASA
jgi:hypothetical protein